jgi:hypothetical protein
MPIDNWMVSPKYDMNSLREGRALPIDVFEDAIGSWILHYASRLADLKENDAGMAVMILVAAYPETIECYSTGRDSKNRSKEFFRNGMKRVFPELTEVSDIVLDGVCDDLRNGLYHASMLKGSLVLVPEGKAVDHAAEEQVFKINPFEFLRRVEQHFAEYVARLRGASAESQELGNFLKYWNTRHAPEDHTVTASCAESAPVQEIVTSTAAPIDLRRVVRKM